MCIANKLLHHCGNECGTHRNCRMAGLLNMHDAATYQSTYQKLCCICADTREGCLPIQIHSELNFS